VEDRKIDEHDLLGHGGAWLGARTIAKRTDRTGRPSRPREQPHQTVTECAGVGVPPIASHLSVRSGSSVLPSVNR